MARVAVGLLVPISSCRAGRQLEMSAPNVRIWLGGEVRTRSPVRPLYPRKPTSERRVADEKASMIIVTKLIRFISRCDGGGADLPSRSSSSGEVRFSGIRDQPVNATV